MDKDDWANKLFQSVDNKNVDAFLAFLSDGVSFRFGNAEPVHGKTEVGQVVRGFFDSVKGLRHELAETWRKEDALICHGIVTYTRHDSSTLSVPFANIFKIRDDLIEGYFIYVDVSELYGST